MIEKILTIGIPTFNGAAALKPNIDNLISIIEKLNLLSEINILVSINASTDNSEEICKEYKKFNYFDYYVQKENVGFDKNVDSVVNNSLTPYVWILSDDDAITEKGLSGILNIIKLNSPSYIFVNHKESSISKSMGCGYKIYNNTEQFISEMKFACGLISSTIVSKSLWKNWNVEKYITTAWIHMGYVIELLNHAPGNYITVFDTDYLEKDRFCRGTPAWGGNGTFLLIGFSLVNMIFDNLDKRNKAAFYWGRRVIAGGYPRNLILARYNGLKLTKEIKNNIKRASSYNLLRYYFLILPVILMPDFLIKCICGFIRFIIRRIKKLIKLIINAGEKR